MKRCLIVLTIDLAVLCVGALAFAQTPFSVKGSETTIFGLVSDGSIVGQAYVDGTFCGYIKRPDQKDVKCFLLPGSIATGVTGFDSKSGCMIGIYTDAESLSLAGFSKHCGTRSIVQYSFGDITFPAALRRESDGSFTVVGFYSTNGGTRYSGFVQRGDQSMQPYMVPGAASTKIYGIDERGRIAGQFTDNKGRPHGFVSDGTNVQIVDAHAPNAVATGVVSLSAWCLLGFYITDKDEQIGFVRYNGNLADDITFSFGAATFPTSLRANGKVGGYYLDNTVGYRGFVSKFAAR